MKTRILTATATRLRVGVNAIDFSDAFAVAEDSSLEETEGA